MLRRWFDPKGLLQLEEWQFCVWTTVVAPFFDLSQSVLFGLYGLEFRITRKPNFKLNFLKVFNRAACRMILLNHKNIRKYFRGHQKYWRHSGLECLVM